MTFLGLLHLSNFFFSEIQYTIIFFFAPSSQNPLRISHLSTTAKAASNWHSLTLNQMAPMVSLPTLLTHTLPRENLPPYYFYTPETFSTDSFFRFSYLGNVNVLHSFHR